MLGTRGAPARYGGFETAVEEIGGRLADRGHEVTVYCRNPGQKLAVHRGMRLVNLPTIRLSAAETLAHTGLSVGHVLSHQHPDVAFLFNAANAPWIPALRRAKIPVATHVDGLEWQRAKWGPRARKYYRWAESRCAAWSDDVIADAHGIVAHLHSKHGIVAHYLPYGAPLVNPDPQRLSELRLTSRGYHLIVARFEPENHVLELIAGYLAAESKLPLVVVGDAPYSARYRERVVGLAQPNPSVRLLGSVWDNDLLDVLYAHSLTYLHGHSVGGTNPSLLRAMGAGAPVVAWDVVFNREVAGAAGRYVSGPADVAAQILVSESDVSSARARGIEGQVDVTCRYCWDEVALGYESLAEELVRRTSRRPVP